MDHLLFARLALSAFCVVQSIAQLTIDLNRTHASNPDWTGHARFHVVWQSVTVALLSFGALYPIWSSHFSQAVGFYEGVGLASLSPFGFIAALMTRKLYGGRLHDVSGILPVRVATRSKVYSVDLNLVAVVMGFAALFVIVCIYWW
ncbi:MAG: hypothetical protein HIU91_01925 [Acidobacteria bacterium]|nr:hypothetical protein [Acidobacteriota bacterium]